jgi:hypothetical protein
MHTVRLALDRYVAGSRGKTIRHCEALCPREATRAFFEEILIRSDHKVRLLLNAALENCPA